MNDLSQVIRTFNRFELKYPITLSQAEKLKPALRAYMVPDENGSSNGRYTLSSLYYDSPGFRCLRENLDGIKFRRKLRVRRYETARELAADIDRHLSGDPIEACPPSAVYRLRKVVAKYRGAALAGTAIAMTLLVATFLSTWFAVCATKAEQVALLAQRVIATQREDQRS